MSIRIENIETILIKPLEMLFKPLSPEARPIYLDAFKSATDTELRAAYEYARDTYDMLRFPPIAVLKNAIKAHNEQRADRAPVVSGDGPRWVCDEERKNEEAHRLSNAYVKQYADTSPLAREARSDLWDWWLMNFVSACAWVQAQKIAGVRNIGYDSSVIARPKGEHGGNLWPSKAEIHRILDEHYRQAALGYIDVSVPHFLIAEWSKYGAIAKSRQQQPAPPPVITIDAPKAISAPESLGDVLGEMEFA